MEQTVSNSTARDAPLPACPKTTTLETMRALAGNEMLAAVLKEHDELKKLLGQWQALADLAEKRLPAWETLNELLDHANGLPEAAGHRTGTSRPRDQPARQWGVRGRLEHDRDVEAPRLDRPARQGHTRR